MITGAASGIGLALAKALHARRVTTALVDIDAEALDAAHRSMPGSSAHRGDLADAAAVRRLAEEILSAHGRVHLLVNNAGVSAAGTVEALPIEQFRRTMDVNFWAVLHLCRAFLPSLRESAARGEGAAICNVLSDFALFSLPTKSPYAASKHAARALTEALGAELHAAGISVSAVYPGATRTALVARGFAVDDGKRRREAEFLLQGLAPETVAARIVRGLERGRSRILIGRDTRAIDAAVRLAPSLFQAGIRRFWRRVPFL